MGAGIVKTITNSASTRAEVQAMAELGKQLLDEKISPRKERKYQHNCNS